jgi:YfiH family protein
MLEYGWNKLYPDIFCFSTTRHGGCSVGEYASLNCNEYCGDTMEHVLRNREIVLSLLPGKTARLVMPHQTHGCEVRVIDAPFLAADTDTQKRELEGVDALVTSLKGVCLGISTADCIPVLCYDTKRQVVAAVHAGWRGTCGKIVSRTLQTLHQTFGTEMQDVVACIGPGISVEAFEVGDEVWKQFAEAGFDMDRIARREDKWHIDLWEANRWLLLNEGVLPHHIEVSGICTWTQHMDFFSARRQGIVSGRILSGIMIKDSL